MRDKRFMIVIAFAVVFGLVAAGLVGRYLSNLEGRSTKVVVAKVNIPLGTMITAEQVTTQHFPKAITPKGIFTDPEKLIGRVSITNIAANEPFIDMKLAPIGSEAGLTGVIAEGFRAITVKVDDVVGIAGLVSPGSWVDIVAVVTPEGQGSNQGPTSKIVLQHIRVLATNQDIDQGSEKGQKEKTVSMGAAIKAVTLQVLPEQAEKLALAQAEGKLQLVMRNSVDKDEVQTPGSNKRSLLTGEGIAQVPEPRAALPLAESGAARSPSENEPPKVARTRRSQPPPIFMPIEKNKSASKAEKPKAAPTRKSVEVFESGKRRTVEFP
ncbi:MAG: Flp pilus assembly protein CpaB [Acidobacteriota bacterium]